MEQDRGASDKSDRAVVNGAASASAVPASIPSAETFANMARCPDYPDYPTAWAIQRWRGAGLDHDPECSSVPGWHPMSGPGFLCDCGAVTEEWERLRDTEEAREAIDAQAIEARQRQDPQGLGPKGESAVA